MKVLEIYKKYCNEMKLQFENIESIKSYQEDTLFCIAGMQRYKYIFEEKELSKIDVICNNQAVLRCNDIEEINDKTHYLYFNMLGYFDFNKKSYEDCFGFWFSFLFDTEAWELNLGLDLYLDYIEYHPMVKKLNPMIFQRLQNMNVNLKENPELSWNGSGYCTEFYVDGVEVGNIVLLENGMLDCGFGLERLEAFYNKEYKKPNEIKILETTAQKIIECGYFPKSNGKQEFILWDILKRLVKMETNSIPADIEKEFNFVKEKYLENQKKYEKLKDKFPNKSKEWWKDTHGIYLD